MQVTTFSVALVRKDQRNAAGKTDGLSVTFDIEL